jgi:hypothetical protein
MANRWYFDTDRVVGSRGIVFAMPTITRSGPAGVALTGLAKSFHSGALRRDVDTKVAEWLPDAAGVLDADPASSWPPPAGRCEQIRPRCRHPRWRADSYCCARTPARSASSPMTR